MFQEKMDSPTTITITEFGDNSNEKKQKVPRRVLHFSDGALEEYSTDEEEEEQKQEEVKKKKIESALIDIVSILIYRPEYMT